MKLLQQIIDGATDTSTEVSEVLLKCLRLAYQLKYDPFKEWVNHELKGYPNTTNLPTYRVLHTMSLGNFQNPFLKPLLGKPIPSAALPDSYHKMATTIELVEGLAYYASQDDTGGLRSPWDHNAVLYIQDQIYREWRLIRAWRVIGPGVFRNLIAVVRARILEFALELAEAYPNIDENTDVEEVAPREKIAAIYHLTIQGGHNVFGGQSNVSTVAMEVDMSNKNDFTFTNSQVGMVNTGKIAHVGTINAHVQALSDAGQTEAARAFAALSKAFQDTEELSENQREQALEAVEELSHQAALPEGERAKPAMIRGMIGTVAQLASIANVAMSVWTQHGELIHHLFSLIPS